MPYVARFVSSRKKAEPKWRTVERVVAQLESALTPTARIEHDVHLPVLGSPTGDTRQCDVVVRTGGPHRETLTIVEVQRRGRKVELNTFGGWLHKMVQVGAQHLICVSTNGFPDSVIHEAARRGPSVRLLTLKEVEEGRWPFDAFGLQQVDTLTVSPSEEVVVDALDGVRQAPGAADWDDPCLEDPQGHRRSLQELSCTAAHALDWSGAGEGWHTRVIKIEPLLLHLDGRPTSRVRLRFQLRVCVERRRVPLVVDEYRHVDADAIAWVVNARQDGGPEFTIAFTRDATGRLCAANFAAAGLPEGSLVRATLGGATFEASTPPRRPVDHASSRSQPPPSGKAR